MGNRMTMEHLEALLRGWGREYGERRADESESEPGSRPHPLEIAKQYAPGKRSRFVRQRTAMDRTGFDRRAAMGQAAGLVGEKGRARMAPMWACDPVTATETRSSRSGARDWPVPLVLQQVQRASLDLHAVDEVRALCLRMEYCTRGPQAEKAEKVSAHLGESIKLRRYRESLAHAKGWMHAMLASRTGAD